MKPYRGILNIVCLERATCPNGRRKNVTPTCVECPAAEIQILNLDRKVIKRFRGWQAGRVRTKKTVNPKP